MDLYQVCSNIAPWVNNGPTAGVTKAYIKSTFSEYGHVTYQIKRNEAYNNMLANVLPLHTPLTPQVGRKVGLKDFFKHGHVAYQFDGEDRQNRMQVKFSS